MRTFIAIDIPEEIKDKIIEIQNKLPEFNGKKTERENLHLTLKFLGEVDENKIEEVKERLKQIRFHEFVAEINSIGVFDNTRSNKYEQQIVVWIGIKNCEKLQKEIDNVLVGLFNKERRFMGHLTIARIKKVNDKKKLLEEINKIKIESMSFNVEGFELKKSILTEKGSYYETLEKYSSGKYN